MPFTLDTFSHLFSWDQDPQRQEKIINARLEAEFDGIDTGLSTVASDLTTLEGTAVTAASAFTNDNRLVRSDGTGRGAQASGILLSDTDALSPATNDAGALGTTSLMWSDLFLASGAVINWNNGDATITHSANQLSFAGAAYFFTAQSGGDIAAVRFNTVNAAEAVGFGFTEAGSTKWVLYKETNNNFRINDFVNGVNAIDFSPGTTATGYSRFGSQLEVPNAGTTASAANAFYDNANNNRLLRSTSSLRYKTDIQNVERTTSQRIIAGLRPIRYRSLAEADRKDWTWYGLAAEDVAALDPRLVHWGYKEGDFDTVIDTVPITTNGGKRVAVDKRERRLRPGAELVPEGVQYDRLVVHLINEVQRLSSELDVLRAGQK